MFLEHVMLILMSNSFAKLVLKEEFKEQEITNNILTKSHS